MAKWYRKFINISFVTKESRRFTFSYRRYLRCEFFESFLISCFYAPIVAENVTVIAKLKKSDGARWCTDIVLISTIKLFDLISAFSFFVITELLALQDLQLFLQRCTILTKTFTFIIILFQFEIHQLERAMKCELVLPQIDVTFTFDPSIICFARIVVHNTA